MSKYTAVSLFCGAGGLDMGFEQAGIHTIWANDFNQDACNTHELWSDAAVVCGDIGKIDKATIPVADVMLGGFPCQGFSLSGPRKLDDSRNTLYKHYVEIVQQNQPKVFVGENVKGLLSMGNGEIIDAIIAAFADCGYDVFYELVNAKNYGVPQDRERVIITGFRHDMNVQQFQLLPFNGETAVLRDAIGKLPSPTSEDVCQEAYSPRYMSRNRKRDWNNVSFTIPAMAKQVALHPSSPDMIKLGKDEWVFGEGETRRLSWQEAAAIQTFPENMQFCGNLTSKYKQIGNAVPVKLAYHVAVSILPILDSHNITL